ncbi:MAG TPA: glycosyltransferase 87 family protein [Gaiellaceae bacterium]|nr:glycosyltransferase 87 family protein [Gaiellaceae bacterium]
MLAAERLGSITRRGTSLSGPATRRAALAAGLCALVFTAAASGLAWVSGSPLVPRHGGHSGGNRAWSVAFLVLLSLAFIAYVGGAWLVRRVPPRTRAVAAIACAIQLAPLAAPLLLSTDAWTYWDYGRIAVVHDANPYEQPPSHFPDDPAYPYVGIAWRNTTSVYGPAFTLASEPLSRAAGTSADAAAWIYKSLAAVAMLAIAFLAARLSRRPALAWAVVGWSPVLAIDFAGGGHNDAWPFALVLAALAVALSGRRELAGAGWALAALIKWIPLVLLPLRLVEARARRVGFGYVGLAAAAAAMAVLGTWRYGFAWTETLRPLKEHAERETAFALPHRLSQFGVPHGVAIALFAAAFALAYLWLLRGAWRGHARLGLAAGLLLLAIPYLAAWYVVWTLPLAAAEDDEPAILLGLVLSAYLLSQTIRV